MTREEEKLLFRALSEILDGQTKLMRHLGVSKHDGEWGWSDSDREDIARECREIGYEA